MFKMQCNCITYLQYHCIFDDWTTTSYRRYDYQYEPFNTKRKVYLDTELFVPEDELSHIEANYGKDWKVPKTYWNIAKSPSNVHRTNIILDRLTCTNLFDTYIKENG